MNTATYLACDTANGGYRFGFGGQMKENDISGVEGGHLTYIYRIHDRRLGRFLSGVPLGREFPWNSAYAFAENDVISCIDLEGLEKYFSSKGKMLGQQGESNEIRIVLDEYLIRNFDKIRKQPFGGDWLYYGSMKFTQASDYEKSNVATEIFK